LNGFSDEVSVIEQGIYRLEQLAYKWRDASLLKAAQGLKPTSAGRGVYSS
jgi:hypothetical protein